MKSKKFAILVMALVLIFGEPLGQASALMEVVHARNQFGEAKDKKNLPSAQSQVKIYWHQQTFGETGVAYLADNTHINNPDGIGLDGAGNLWVAEGAGARVLKYTTEGTFLMSIGTAGLTYLADKTHFASPRDVAVDSGGNLWVTDMVSNRVVKFDPAGNYLTQLGITWEGGTDNAHFNGPVGVALDSEGNIYISDFYNHRVQVFDSTGFYSTTIGVTGVSGTDNAHFNTPNHITLDTNNNLYVVDERNHRVQIFDSSHNYSATLGVSG